MSAPDSREVRPGETAGPSRSTSRQRDRSGLVSAFRFLQTSDFRLDTPCHGVTGLPGALRETLAESRFVAAERVFNIAIEREVDFVVLAGGLLDATLPGLRGPWFLTEQFRRLAKHGIDVYWAGATFETRRRWPSYVELPTNVHRLTADGTGILHGRHGHPLARLLTMQDPAAAKPLGPDVYTIAVQPGCIAPLESFPPRVDYWALGGQAGHETVQSGDVVVHFAGSPQGRFPGEPGRHSCSVVDVLADRCVRIEPVATDTVRWHQLRLSVESTTHWSELEERFSDHLKDLTLDPAVELNLLSWTVQGEGLAFQRLLEPHLRAEFIQRLNRCSVTATPLFWTTDICCHIGSQQRDRLQRTDTPLGEVLRELHELSPHIPRLFGAAADGEHPLGEFEESQRDELIEMVLAGAVQHFGDKT